MPKAQPGHAVHLVHAETKYTKSMREGLVGEAQKIWHLDLATEQATNSLPLSIHQETGTGADAFNWAMIVDYIDYSDMNFIKPKDLR